MVAALTVPRVVMVARMRALPSQPLRRAVSG